MNVLVTGATTPLGAALVEHLLASSDVDHVLAVGREADPRGLAPRPGLDYHATDLAHARQVHDLLWGPGRTLDAVFHATHHRDAREHGRAVHAQNVEATRELVQHCAAHPRIRRFVYRSFAEVYALPDVTTTLIDEDAPLDFDPAAPQWLRDRVEADATVCTQLAGDLRIAILRCAELLAPSSGSQLADYLASRVCLRPAGFDPMLNVLTIPDAVAAIAAALRGDATGVFNIPGADTLPLSRAIAESGRLDLQVPGVLIAPLYRLRRWIAGFEFRYDLNVRRFHFGGVLDGTRARHALGYAPRTRVRWPVATRGRPRLPGGLVAEGATAGPAPRA